jgi:DNA polymerase sigma
LIILIINEQQYYNKGENILVFPYGSVPLKTYLPDGDIDLEVFLPLSSTASYLTHLPAMLEKESASPLPMSMALSSNSNSSPGLLNQTAMIQSDRDQPQQQQQQQQQEILKVRGVTTIVGDVKIIKCVVNNVTVDISFNNIGGIRTLAFLEAVDGLIGKDHLLKKSILLIKAWCYYETRLVGSHHGTTLCVEYFLTL